VNITRLTPILLFSLLFYSGGVFALSEGTSNKQGTYRAFGKIIDAKTKKGMDYVAVSILAADKDSLITGMLTESNGEFSFDNLSIGSYRLKAVYEGYTPVIKKVTISASNPEQDLGNIAMQVTAHNMNEVTVTADRAASTLSVDKKVFNVDKDISSRGGNALDVMQNLPGVAVDADGNVTLRNNTPLVYVDGKPTTLTLDQIPSDQIDRIEVITNPSAKYEAAASGGIINVVMKHNTKPGYNGLITALAGTNDQYNGTAMINVHKGIIGASLSANVSGATNTTQGYDNRVNLNTNTAPSSYFDQNQQKTNERRYENIRAGLDFYISNRNTLSLTQTVVFGWFDNTFNTNQTNMDSTNTQTSFGRNYNLEAVTRRNYTTMLDFRHTYPRRGKEYNITLQYDRRTSVTTFIDTTNTYDPSGNILPGSRGVFKQSIPSGTESHTITAQWDFTHPLRDSIKLEYGVRGYYQRINSFANTDSFGNGVYASDQALTTDFLTQQTINAAYFSISQHVKRFSYQIGVRYEEDYFLGQLLNLNQTFSYKYPQSPSSFYQGFFPSFFLSQSINEHHLFQLNATRKTNRPSNGQLNPNLEVIDQKDYTKGNAALQPEFINQGEINYDMTYRVIDWLSSAYARYTQNPIVGVNTYNDTTDILLATYTNGTGKFNYGWENTFKFFPVKGLSITADVNLFYTSIQAYLPEGDKTVLLTNQGLSYTAKGIIVYKFPLGFSAQINGSYEAPKPVPQGTTLPVYYFDFAASKELGPLTINLGVSDVLNTHASGYNYYVPDEYTQYLYKRRQTRYAKLGLTFRFGKDDKVTKKRSKKDKGKEKESEDDAE
jgi:iron complex outermembrane receptor protein